MKFELVEFYPTTDKNRKNLKSRTLGSLHIYVIDCQLDIRGIRITKQGKNDIYFHMPHYLGYDGETGEKVRFPFMRWTLQKDHDDMMDFLHKQAKPEILKRLKNQK